MEKEKTRLLIVPNKGRDCPFALVLETGEVLASHFCSHQGFAKADLVTGRPERQEKYKKRFGEYEVMFLNEQDIITEEILRGRNAEFYKDKTKA